jgi:hypothetical protein
VLRRAWVLALLSAVFLMHGAPSMATDTSAASSAVPSSHAEMASSHDGGGAPLVAASLGSESVVPAVTPLDSEPPEDGAPTHTTAGHLWTACLAVLLAGLVLFAALLIRRLPAALRHHAVAARLRGALAWLRPPRPPDLFALCLLRT